MTHNFFVIKNVSYYMTHVTKQFLNKQTCVGVAEIEEYPNLNFKDTIPIPSLNIWEQISHLEYLIKCSEFKS